MPNLTIKNIPLEIYHRLKENADLNRRSLNSEIIVSLERAVKSTPVDPGEFLNEVRALRKQMKGGFLTDDFLKKAKEQGRP